MLLIIAKIKTRVFISYTKRITRNVVTRLDWLIDYRSFERTIKVEGRS
jgi:hypothetical protein